MAFLIPENLASRSDVPQRLQAVARAFRDLLDDSVTVWLEEGDDPHLLVLDPARGILVVDAPKVGRRSGLRRRSVNRVEVSAQVRARATELEERVEAERRLEDLPVEAVVALPDVARADLDKMDLDVPHRSVFTREDFTREGLAPAFSRVLGEHQPLEELGERVVRGLIRPELIISGNFEESDGQLVFRPPEAAPEDVIRVLDRQQENLARHLGDGYRVIRGVAGSGKTLVLMFRAKFLAEHFPQWRILVTCYNVVLAQALRKFVSDLPNVQVRNIDTFVPEILGRSFRPKEDGDWVEGRRRAVEMLRRSGPRIPRYDVVLVDEAQDFDHDQLDLAYGLLKEGRDHFVTAIDNAQNIYRRRSRWNPPGQTARGRTKLLRVNYRNTKEILEFAMRFLTGGSNVEFTEAMAEDPDVIVPPEATSRRGERPRVYVANSQKDEAEFVARLVAEAHEAGASFDSMAIIYGSSSVQKSLYWAFKELDLPYFWVTRNRETKSQVFSVQDTVRSSTTHSLKGLEFSKVFVCGANAINTHDDDPDSVRRLLYVAMTRAMDHLVVTASGDGPIVRDLVAAGS